MHAHTLYLLRNRLNGTMVNVKASSMVHSWLDSRWGHIDDL